MKVSVDLTLSPLQDDYEAHIIAFIKMLRASDFTVLENPLSKESFQKTAISLLTMKIVKTDRSDYDSNF